MISLRRNGKLIKQCLKRAEIPSSQKSQEIIHLVCAQNLFSTYVHVRIRG